MKKWLINLIMVVVGGASPELRTSLINFLREFRESAKKTANPLDDILADALLFLVGAGDIED